MPLWTLAKKEFRLLLRDRLAAIILLGMPLVFVLILGMLLGDSFGQKERLRISVVTLDKELLDENGAPREVVPGLKTWADVVQRDLAETGGVVVEMLGSEAEAEQLIREHRRAAVLIFGPNFSKQVDKCSFLVGGVNPFYRDGVYLDEIDVRLLKDRQQIANSAVIEQVAQVSLLRVLLPVMIGRAFGKLSDEKFIEILGEEVNIPTPTGGSQKLGQLLRLAAFGIPSREKELRERVGKGVQAALTKQFESYDLTGLTWAQLTRAKGPGGAAHLVAQAFAAQGLAPATALAATTGILSAAKVAEADAFTQEGTGRTGDQGEGLGFLNRGAARYQILVPSYTVMFAFFLVLNVGWILVAERQQGTLKRLRTAPIGKTDILLGKLIPYFLLSLGQGAFLLLAGKLVFGMRWGPDSWPWWQQVLWLVPVVFSTSLAAMGLAMLVAALARTEAQVTLYGAVPVLIMALIGGCVLPRDLMPEQTQAMTLLTPHGWALSAYRELLTTDPEYIPNTDIVVRACLVLSGFGLAFLATAWASLRLED